MRRADSRVETKTLPSPISPVRSARTMASTAAAAAASETTTSTFTLGTRSTVYSAPRYCSLWPFWRPKPRTSLTVSPWMPTWVRADFTSSSLWGLTIASIFFTFGSLSFQFRGLEVVVSGLAVQREVQTLRLLFGLRTEADHRVDDLQDHEAAHRGDGPGEARGDRLVCELGAAAVEADRLRGAGRLERAADERIDLVGREDSRQERAEGSA